jgi:hypothetical protein
MVAHIPALALCQYADEELMIEMGSVIYPGFVDRVRGANGLRLTLEGDYRDERLVELAADQFQTLLGVLRAWRPLAGQRADEVRPGIGQGSIRDEQGNQVIMVGSAIAHTTIGSEVKTYANLAKLAMARSVQLADALWLNGRRDRNAADFYMIYEYAEDDLGGRSAIVKTLGVSDNDIKRLRGSANNLAPTDGGRHAKGSGTPEWSLDRQREFIGRFLKQWILYRANSPA